MYLSYIVSNDGDFSGRLQRDRISADDHQQPVQQSNVSRLRRVRRIFNHPRPAVRVYIYADGVLLIHDASRQARRLSRSDPVLLRECAIFDCAAHADSDQLDSQRTDRVDHIPSGSAMNGGVDGRSSSDHDANACRRCRLRDAARCGDSAAAVHCATDCCACDGDTNWWPYELHRRVARRAARFRVLYDRRCVQTGARCEGHQLRYGTTDNIVGDDEDVRGSDLRRNGESRHARTFEAPASDRRVVCRGAQICRRPQPAAPNPDLDPNRPRGQGAANSHYALTGKIVQVRFVVQVPPTTPMTDAVYLATDISGWNPSAIRMERLDALHYAVMLPLRTGTEFLLQIHPRLVAVIGTRSQRHRAGAAPLFPRRNRAGRTRYPSSRRRSLQLVRLQSGNRWTSDPTRRNANAVQPKSVRIPHAFPDTHAGTRTYKPNALALAQTDRNVALCRRTVADACDYLQRVVTFQKKRKIRNDA